MHRLAIRVSAIPQFHFPCAARTKTIYSVLQMQITIVTLLENFEVSLPPQNERTKIYRKPSHVMMPMAQGHRGAWMGLLVKSVNRRDAN
jgi:hypothetical protein